MKKKIISDIRLFRSEAQNEFGGYITSAFADRQLNAALKRIVMKLREDGFSLGEFDHLYINFTTCDLDEPLRLSDRVDRYHPWYRFCDVHVEEALYQRLGSPDAREDIIRWVRTILAARFASEDFDEARIHSCVQQALEQGERMLVTFKEKVSATRRAVLFLRYLDSGRFYPLLRVYGPEDQLLFETDLPKAVTLDHLGEIQLSAKRVTVKPRKNPFAEKLHPLTFEYGVRPSRMEPDPRDNL